MTVCTNCQADNVVGANFCSSCGSAMAPACPSCGAAAQGRFCSNCGTPLAANSLPAQRAVAAPPEASAKVAERRITSVLFADLVAFTPLAESLDPEDVRELLSRYFASARTVVERYGGVVEKFIGDAVMAVWGVPVAHEDDAERAVRAGLDLVDVVSVLGEQVGHPELAMRVGVVTGEVAATMGATGEGMVAGDAVNTAARVQTAAEPRQVLVDEQTRSLTAAAIDYADCGAHPLKGKAEPVRLYAARQVVAGVGGSRRIDGLEAPFVGRDRELRLIKEMFHATLEERRPRLVAVFGPPGVGKSRLGWEFDKYFDGITSIIHGHRGRCLSYGEGVAFWALAEIVRYRLEVLEGDPNDVVVERLSQGLERYVPDAEERAWLFPRIATLIGVADLVAPGATFPRDDLFAAWRTFLERVAVSEGAAGAVLRIDDLQWADDGLLAFLDYLLQTAQAPLFILVLARTDLLERVPALGTGRRANALHLEPLPDAAMAQVVDGLIANLPESVREALVSRAEGVPLFAVETVRALIDRDAVVPHEGRYVLAEDAERRADLRQLALPTSLHTLIASRLDALPGGERRVVQDASVLGTAFTRADLAALTGATGGEAGLDETLASLVRREFFTVESDPRSPERGQYRFVQALVKTVAYETLSRHDRKARHLAAADLIAAMPDVESVPAVLASHYVAAYQAAAGDPDAVTLAAKAVDLLERAAQHAQSLGAPQEARQHLETALSLTTDASRSARLTELAGQAALAMGASADAAQLFEQARDGYATLGRDLDAYRALASWGEARIAAAAGEQVVEPLAAAFTAVADRPEAAAVAAQLALQVARAYYVSIGDSRAAIPWFDRAVDLVEVLEDLPLLAQTLASYGGALTLIGRPRMGIGLLRVALDLARQTGDHHSELRPLNNLISFMVNRDLPAALSYADEAMPLARRAGVHGMGRNLVATAAHVLWAAGEWDRLLDLSPSVEDDTWNDSLLLTLRVYVAAVRTARGLALDIPDAALNVADAQADATLRCARALLAAAVARERGALAEAAEASTAAMETCRVLTGVDDDFPIYWLTAMTDALAIPDLPRARRVLAIVSETPKGHLPIHLRAALPRFRALLRAAEGDPQGVEADLTAAIGAIRDYGAPFELAQTLLDYAGWLDGQGRRVEAEAPAREAAQIFARLQAKPWLDRVARVLPELADSALP